MTKVLTFVGGISKNSLNRRLFSAVREMAMHQQLETEAFDLTKLPFFSQDLEDNPSQEVIELREKIRGANAILFITPEYNRSFPGVLKNAVDWGSRPYGHNSFDGKPAAVMGASSGNIGTFGAQHHLRQVLAYLNMQTMGQPEFYLNASKSFDQEGNLIDEKTRSHIDSFLISFHDWIESVEQNREGGQKKIA